MNRLRSSRQRALFHTTLLATVSLATAGAQVVTPPAGSAGGNTTIVNRQPPKRETPLLGNDLPLFNPGSDTVTWQGTSFNISNNRLFRARFEKFLSAPEFDTESDQEYEKILKEVLELLAPTRSGGPDADAAYGLLPKASSYPSDSNLCDSLANAIYAVILSRKDGDGLRRANGALEKEHDRLLRNLTVILGPDSFEAQPTSSRGKSKSKGTGSKKDAKSVQAADLMKRIAEVEAMRKLNDGKRGAGQIQSKIEYQALLAQFFLQRRFQHVIMGTRFYPLLFREGKGKLHVQKGSDVQKIFTEGIGFSPTIATLEALAKEATSDVRSGVAAFEYHLEKTELVAATERLQEAYLIGEYLPELRTLPRDRKRRTMDYFQRLNRLLNAFNGRDYGMAEELVDELKVVAVDFDYTLPQSKIEAAKTEVELRLAAALDAGSRGDRETVKDELTMAAQAWPASPRLREVRDKIFQNSGDASKAINDFDRLLAQKAYRQIFDNRIQFIQAVAIYPDRQEQLREVLERVKEVETAVAEAGKLAEHGSSAGGWEVLERFAADNPNDQKLNQLRYKLAKDANEFVKALETAKEMEGSDQIGSSMAWFLKAKQLYGRSKYAQEGIDRMVALVFPDSVEEEVILSSNVEEDEFKDN